jgi:hypothetical protein
MLLTMALLVLLGVLVTLGMRLMQSRLDPSDTAGHLDEGHGYGAMPAARH